MNSCEVPWQDRKKPHESIVIDIESIDGPACAIYPKSLESWEDQMYERLQSLNVYFSITKLGGTLDYPCHTFRGNTSKTFKIYAMGLCTISFAFTVQSLIYFFFPSLVPETYVILTKGSGRIAKYAVPLWSLANTTLRVSMIRLLLDKDFSKNIRQVLWDITNDPHLRDHGIPMKKLPLYLSAPSALFMFFFCVFFVFALTRYRLSLCDPVLYSLLLGVFLYHSSFEVIAWYLGLLTFKLVLTLLKVTNKRFLHATETVSARSLQEAIACHDKCWNLIKCIDRIGGKFMGVCLTLTVPTTVITVSFLGTMSREPGSFYPIMLWTIWFFGSIGYLTYVTGSIHAAAHVPDEILTRKVYTCPVFKEHAFQFRARFANRSIGYTYFGFTTFRKETLLTVLNLVATYVVVGFQLRSNVPSKPPSNQMSMMHESLNCTTEQP